MHRPAVSKGLAFLAAIFALFAITRPLHAAEPQIKPFILTGDSAPDGGVFTSIGFGSFSINNLGAIAFVGSTTTGQGIYLASESAGSQVMAQKVIKPGDSVTIPELLLSGVLIKKEPSTFPGVINYEFSDGHRLSCSPNGNLGFNLGGSLLNDNGDIAFRSGTSPLLFSGGTITSLSGCPGVTHLLMDLNPADPSAGFPNDTIVSAINNAGTVALKLFIRPFTTPRGLFGERHFLVSGGIPSLLSLVDTEAPDGGTIFVASFRALNDSGDALVLFNEHSSPSLNPADSSFCLGTREFQLP